VGRNRGSILLMFIVGLAVGGVLYSLVNDPIKFLSSILLMIGVAAILFFIVRAVLNRGNMGTSDEADKYKKAVKQAQQKYKQEKSGVNKSAATTKKIKPKKKRRNASHLTVIEGKKDKKKGNNNGQASNKSLAFFLLVARM